MDSFNLALYFFFVWKLSCKEFNVTSKKNGYKLPNTKNEKKLKIQK